jgi:hypothetical protein
VRPSAKPEAAQTKRLGFPKPIIHPGDRSFNRPIRDSSPPLYPLRLNSAARQAARRHHSILIQEHRRLGAFVIHNRHAQGAAGAPWVDFGFAQDGLEAR